MGFWDSAKTGAGLGMGGSFGARVGWELGGWVVTWLNRLIILVPLAIYNCQGHFKEPAPSADKPAVVKKEATKSVAKPENKSQNQPKKTEGEQ